MGDPLDRFAPSAGTAGASLARRSIAAHSCDTTLGQLRGRAAVPA